MPHPTRKRSKPADSAKSEIARLLLASKKFINWKPAKFSLRDLEESHIMAEKHYTPTELAQMWGVSVQTIRDLFKDEDGVLKLGSDGTRTRRAYKTLRIPHSVAERVHTRLSC
jgi:hypothetical protein